MLRYRSLYRCAGLAVLVVLVLAGAPSASAHSATRPPAVTSVGQQSLPGDLLRTLRVLTGRAVRSGKKILTSEEAAAAKKIAKTTFKLSKYYCDQWLDSFGRRRFGTELAVYSWWSIYNLSPRGDTGKAYSVCRGLLYWPILLYGP
jgi:hypothetical protein